ncbi:MAG: hypothetical protein R3282_02775, partial [Rhodothermales bacterium]|nr:hypothetical protein [Rhodothermales bacterium]
MPSSLLLRFIQLAFLLLLSIAWKDDALAQSATALSERPVAYEIHASLDPATKKVVGTQTLAWRNRGPTAVSELQFHLYLNGFRDNHSTYMRESGGQFRGMRGSPDHRGSIVLTELYWISSSDAGAANELTPVSLLDRMIFIQPDDDNVFDETVFSVTLPSPVPPGERARLTFGFESTLPRVFARTGWEETAKGNLFFLVAQWFPKIGVYEIPGQRYVPNSATEGRWNTHQFHANSEFYADFGTYRVTMDVPADYVVGATGRRISEESVGERKSITYEAEDVHDFAWTASPDFIEYSDEWEHVAIRTLMLPEHERYAERVVNATKISLDRMDRWVGPYPYETLTVVDALGGAVGMEYPTFF